MMLTENVFWKITRNNEVVILLMPKHIFFIYFFPLREKCRYSQFFWSVFSRIRTEYGEIWNLNKDQKNSENGHFSSSVCGPYTLRNYAMNKVEVENLMME